MNQRKAGKSAAFKGIPFEDEYKDLLDYWTLQGYTLPSIGNQVYQNQLVKNLKGLEDGISGGVDLLPYLLRGYFGTNENEDLIFPDWVSAINSGGTSADLFVPYNSPTFTSMEGLTGNGTSSAVLTPTITTPSGNNKLGYLLYLRTNPNNGRHGTNITAATGLESGRYCYVGRTSGDFSQITSPYTTPAAIGAIRVDSSTVYPYKNKTIGTNYSQITSLTQINQKMGIGARLTSESPVTFSNFSTAQVAQAWYFYDFTEAMYFQLYDAIQLYMTQIGKQV